MVHASLLSGMNRNRNTNPKCGGRVVLPVRTRSDPFGDLEGTLGNSTIPSTRFKGPWS